jgi:hypothetical protein
MYSRGMSTTRNPANYRIKQLVSGQYAVCWHNKAGIQNALRVFTTRGEAVAWINNK